MSALPWALQGIKTPVTCSTHRKRAAPCRCTSLLMEVWSSSPVCLQGVLVRLKRSVSEGSAVLGWVEDSATHSQQCRPWGFVVCLSPHTICKRGALTLWYCPKEAPWGMFFNSTPCSDSFNVLILRKPFPSWNLGVGGGGGGCAGPVQLPALGENKP